MWVTLWLVLLGGGAGERVAVMVNDPAGRAESLAEAVVDRLRVEGVDAVPVAAPRQFASAAEQDAAAKQVGANRVVALDVKSHRQQQVASAPFDLYRWHAFQVDGLAVSPTIAPFDRWEDGPLGPVGSPVGPSSEWQALNQIGPLPPTAAVPNERVHEQVTTNTEVSSRRVGSTRPDVHRSFAIDAEATWRRDLVGRESPEIARHEQNLWAAVQNGIADRTTAVLALR